MTKILFITSHRRDRAPNQRFRFEQYISYLEENGFQCIVSPLIKTAAEDTLFYKPGNHFRKIPLGLLLGLRRVKDVLRANKFDIIFIAREAFILGSVFFETLLKQSKAKIIFDFDDAIWLDVISENNRSFSWLKDGSKTSKIIALADKVFAGNEFLADYARKFNRNTVIVPTTIDTEAYEPRKFVQKETVTIGWSGSLSTIEHFQFALPALTILKEKYQDAVDIHVIGDANYKNEKLKIVGKAWNLSNEIKDLQSFDIGVMPLPDNEWTWGKCGLKGLQYMALEIPTIMSPVGVNKEIIANGINGFLADQTTEWMNIISALIENRKLRADIGKAGRKTVLEKYSVVSQRENYLNQFKSLLE
jgi:glycosyltransferase involved in cell wall biosynthesis